MGIRAHAILLAAAVGCLPAALMAQSTDNPSPRQEEERAFEDCGGPPIQGGHPVQPTPDRDACLARTQHIPLPRDLEGPSAPPNYGAIPADQSPQLADRPPSAPPNR